MSPTRRELLLGAAGALVLGRAAGTTGAQASAQQSENLDVALRAERWIRTARVESEHGVVWPADPKTPDSVQRALYNGFPGVVVFLLELFHTTGDRRYLDEAVKGASDLAASIPVDAAAVRDAGLYTGLAGLGFVLEETHRASRDARFRSAAQHALELVKTSAKPVGGGVEWSESTDIISGSAGIGLYLLRASRTFDDRSAVDLAAKAGRRLIERGEPQHGGLTWGIQPSVQNKYPNFSHGAGGVGYFLATLYGVTGDRAFLDGALAAARYLDAIARKENDGWLAFHHEPNGEDLFYLSWCHGPPGSARLFYRLNEVTKDASWLNLVHKCARGTIGTGIPEQRTPGFWNNISQCCGNAGVGEFFLSLHRIAPKPEYLAMAQRSASDTLKRATVDAEGLKWVQAEHRVQPNLLIAQTGFMQGAAGVGTFFLHLSGFARGRKPAIVFPDNPFV
jgi:lantibiotic modifying enzyme